MKTLKIIFSILFMVIIAVGCKTTKQMEQLPKSNLTEIETPFNGDKYQTNKNYFRAVKSGTSDNINNAEQIARTLSINEIGENVGVINKNVTEIYMGQTNQKSGNDFNDMIRQVSKQIVTNISTVDYKVFYDNKKELYTFWVVLEVDKDDVINLLLEKASDEKVKINREEFTEVYNEEMGNL